MAQARVPACFMFIPEHASRRELLALPPSAKQAVKQWCVRSEPALVRDLVPIRNFRQYRVFINPSLLAALCKGQLSDAGAGNAAGLALSPQRAQWVRPVQDLAMVYLAQPLLLLQIISRIYFRQVSARSAPSHPAQHPHVPVLWSGPAAWPHPASAGTTPWEQVGSWSPC